MQYQISESVLNELLSILAKLPYENVHQVFARVKEDAKPVTCKKEEYEEKYPTLPAENI